MYLIKYHLIPVIHFIAKGKGKGGESLAIRGNALGTGGYELSIISNRIRQLFDWKFVSYCVFCYTTWELLLLLYN